MKGKSQCYENHNIGMRSKLNSRSDAELYIFTDASKFTYGAVAYFRYKTEMIPDALSLKWIPSSLNEGKNSYCA